MYTVCILCFDHTQMLKPFQMFQCQIVHFKSMRAKPFGNTWSDPQQHMAPSIFIATEESVRTDFGFKSIDYLVYDVTRVAIILPNVMICHFE